VIDTPQLPTQAVSMRVEAEAHGPIRYIINTEHHIDHIFGNYFFKGRGIVVSHEFVFREFMKVTPQLNPFHYAKQAIPTHDPDGERLFPDEEDYFRDPNKPSITFDRDLTLRVGDHTFCLYNTPGHTPGQLAVFIPEEKTVFLGDTIFNRCQTWLYESNVDRWIASLDFIRTLDFDHIVPGHGPLCGRQALDEQRAFLMEWVTAVAAGIARGWSKKECQRRISFLDRFPVDIGQEHMAEFVTQNNISALYDRLTGVRPLEN